MSEIKKPPLTKKDREFFLKFYPKQLQAFHILRNQKTGELCYGGAAGGAKTYLGCAWQLLNRLAYPGTRGLIGRARLKNLKNTTLKTFLEIARSLGLVQGRHFSYNAQTDVLQFENGSEIYLKDLYLYPSDPDFTALGSLEINDAFIDEAGEVSEKAAAITQSRIRYRLDLSGLPPKMLLTCNPTRNWLYAAFYKAAKQKCLLPHRDFLPALVEDNGNETFVNRYKEQLKKLDSATRERLLFGNWDHSDDSHNLFRFQNLQCLFSNSFVQTGKGYISADVARFGADASVVGYWQGLRLVHCAVLQKESTVKTAELINSWALAYRVPKSRIIIDADGIGGGVADMLPGVRSFNAQAKPLARFNRPQNFFNLKTQCFFALAEAIENGDLFIGPEAAATRLAGQTLRDCLTEELLLVKRLPDTEGKLRITSKSEIKEHLGRSPDASDMLMMRMRFELEPGGLHFI